MISNEKLYSALGESIRRYRKERKPRGLTQEELAKKISSTRSTIANIETGSQSVSLHTIYQIAQALEVQVKDIIPNMGQVQTDSKPVKFGSHKINANMAEMFQTLELTTSALERILNKHE